MRKQNARCIILPGRYLGRMAIVGTRYPTTQKKALNAGTILATGTGPNIWESEPARLPDRQQEMERRRRAGGIKLGKPDGRVYVSGTSQDGRRYKVWILKEFGCTMESKYSRVLKRMYAEA